MRRAAVRKSWSRPDRRGNRADAAVVGGGEGRAAGGRPLDDGREEAELIERAKGGDAGAYEALVRRYQDLAFRTAYLLTRDADEAEDAAQAGFLKAWAALGRFRAGAPFRPWLLRIVANEASNRRTAAGRRLALARRLGVETAGSAAAAVAAGEAAPSPEAAALAAERREALLAAVDALREEDRTVIALRYFLDLSEAEMADVLGCARGTVKSRLSRALGRARGLLAGPDLPAALDARSEAPDG